MIYAQHSKEKKVNNKPIKYTDLLSEKYGLLWRATRKLLKHKATISSLKIQDGNWVINNTKKTKTFSIISHFSTKRYGLIRLVLHDPFTCKRNKLIFGHSFPSTLPHKFFSPSEIQTFMKNVPIRNTLGYDLITAGITRKLPQVVLIQLANIYNSIIRISCCCLPVEHITETCKNM